MPVRNEAVFNSAVRLFGESIPDQVKTFHKKVHLEGVRGIVLKTPVKEGVARGSWQTSIGSPPEGETGMKDKTGGKTIQANSVALAPIGAFEVSYIGSNLVYIVPLERGHSKIARSGMVGVTLQELQTMFP